MTTKFLLNGVLVESDSESLLSNRAMQFGDGFFESMHYSDVGIYLWKFHWSRIKKSAKLLKLSIPDEQTFVSQIHSLQPATGSRIKLIIYRSGLGTYFPEQNTKSEYLIFCSEQLVRSTLPISLGNSTTVVMPIGSTFSGVKSLSCLNYVMAAMECSKSSFDELILLNSSNEISECISSNIFVIQADKIYTPPLSSGCVEGVCRSYILEAEVIPGFEVIQKPLFLHDLEQCDGIFISNAVQGVRVVGNYLEKDLDLEKTLNIQNFINKRLFQK